MKSERSDNVVPDPSWRTEKLPSSPRKHRVFVVSKPASLLGMKIMIRGQSKKFADDWQRQADSHRGPGLGCSLNMQQPTSPLGDEGKFADHVLFSCSVNPIDRMSLVIR